ncbi:MAG: hypothetical protein FWG66_00795 [Spirochaetes bacterium]|nr:hypothetical protein [Spirochaetota bacterium]
MVKKLHLGILAMVLAFALVATGCDNNDDTGGGGGGNGPGFQTGWDPSIAAFGITQTQFNTITDIANFQGWAIGDGGTLVMMWHNATNALTLQIAEALGISGYGPNWDQGNRSLSFHAVAGGGRPANSASLFINP